VNHAKRSFGTHSATVLSYKAPNVIHVKDGVRRAVKYRQLALGELLKAIREFRKFNDQPLTLQGGDYAQAVQSLNKAIDRADGLLQP